MPTAARPAHPGALLGGPGAFCFLSSSLPKGCQALAPSCPGQLPGLPRCALGAAGCRGAVGPAKALGPETSGLGREA